MITVAIGHDNVPYVWNADDWHVLRQDHRIVGELVGMLSNLSNQTSFRGLPMMLLPEETTFLLERNIICLKKFPSLCRCPGEGVLKAYKNHRQETFSEQAEQMKEERKQAVVGLLDKIIEGRRRKLLGLDTKKKRKKLKTEDDQESGKDDEEKAKIVQLLKPIDDAERETVLQEELAKIPPLSKENALVQTFTAYPWLRAEDACPVDWTFPSTDKEKTRYFAFKDLWGKGFYITTGHKFGGDFLVYPGDPVKFHSQFVVVCAPHTEGIPTHQLISYGRMGSSVRKTFVLASLPEGSSDIVYQSIRWSGSSSVMNI